MAIKKRIKQQVEAENPYKSTKGFAGHCNKNSLDKNSIRV